MSTVRAHACFVLYSVGSGSTLLAAAYLGAVTVGADISAAVLRGDKNSRALAGNVPRKPRRPPYWRRERACEAINGMACDGEVAAALNDPKASRSRLETEEEVVEVVEVEVELQRKPDELGRGEQEHCKEHAKQRAPPPLGVDVGTNFAALRLPRAALTLGAMQTAWLVDGRCDAVLADPPVPLRSHSHSTLASRRPQWSK
eukprot:SAG11_NODE_2693_length_3090_cov_1.761953_2_plen_201_part_00